jgi:uncharacterized membrane protein YccC
VSDKFLWQLTLFSWWRRGKRNVPFETSTVMAAAILGTGSLGGTIAGFQGALAGSLVGFVASIVIIISRRYGTKR